MQTPADAAKPGPPQVRRLAAPLGLWAGSWLIGLIGVSALRVQALYDPDPHHRFPGLLMSPWAAPIYVVAALPAVAAWVAGRRSVPGQLSRGSRSLARMTAWGLSAFSSLAVALVSFGMLDSCTGTGTGYFACQSFTCSFGTTLATLDAVGVGIGVLLAMLTSLDASPQVRAAVWAGALGYLLYARFAVLIGLGPVQLTVCHGL